jgi:hypothetical protein
MIAGGFVSFKTGLYGAVPESVMGMGLRDMLAPNTHGLVSFRARDQTQLL